MPQEWTKNTFAASEDVYPPQHTIRNCCKSFSRVSCKQFSKQFSNQHQIQPKQKQNQSRDFKSSRTKIRWNLTKLLIERSIHNRGFSRDDTHLTILFRAFSQYSQASCIVSAFILVSMFSVLIALLRDDF